MTQWSAQLSLGRQQQPDLEQVEEEEEVAEVPRIHGTLAPVEVEVKTLDLVAEEAETRPGCQNQLMEEVVVASSPLVAEVAMNQTLWPEEGVEGSQVEPLSRRPWVEAAAEVGGCPWQVEEEVESWTAGFAEGQQVLVNPWQPEEVVEEEGPGREVVEGDPGLMPGVEVVNLQSPDKTEPHMKMKDIQQVDF